MMPTLRPPGPAIIDGTQPVALTLETLVRTRIPLGWADQERLFVFEA